MAGSKSTQKKSSRDDHEKWFQAYTHMYVSMAMVSSITRVLRAHTSRARLMAHLVEY